MDIVSFLWWNPNEMECRFRPRILIDVSKIDMATTVLGFKISMPIMIAPTAMQKMAHPDGNQYLLSLLLFQMKLFAIEKRMFCKLGVLDY